MKLTDDVIHIHLSKGYLIKRDSWSSKQFLYKITPKSDVSSLFTDQNEPWVPSYRQLTCNDWVLVPPEVRPKPMTFKVKVKVKLRLKLFNVLLRFK